MVLHVDLSALHAAVRRMGAELPDFNIGRIEVPIDPIDLRLERGIEIPDLSEVDVSNGLLSYKDRQILLYIQDQGSNIYEVLENGEKGRKFHVADCRTLRDMRQKGRFERYVVTNKLDGSFYVTGNDWNSGKDLSGEARLSVCQNCLTLLRYKGAKQGRTRDIAALFSIEEFFSIYSSFFIHLPNRTAGNHEEEGYSSDWPQISSSYKTSKDFRCESCLVDLGSNKRLLHVHHLSGVKNDNSVRNLQALCASCHRDQPLHGHLFVSHQDTQTINKLRREQGVLREPSRWEQVIKYADPALHGLLEGCRQSMLIAPEVGVIVRDSGGVAVANLEVGWPRSKVGVAINHEDKKLANENGWRVWGMFEALNQFEKFMASARW